MFPTLDTASNVVLLCLGFTSVLFYSLIVVAMWRVSKKMSPFILFTSHVSVEQTYVDLPLAHIHPTHRA